MLNRLGGLRRGSMRLVDRGINRVYGDEQAPCATLDVLHPRFYQRVALGGSLGFAESYLDGDWRTDDLTALLRLFTRNFAAVEQVNGLSDKLKAAPRWLLSTLRRNTRLGSRKNIAAHYDLSNEFYGLWLDESMTYSSAVFPSEGASLLEGSIHKYDRICQKLRLRPTDHVVEIGTGWGGFAEHAAKHYGCRVTTTTISSQQHDYAARRFDQAGLNDRVTLLNQDYRDLSGQFDKLVSIEMIEAVGHEYLGAFFAKCSGLLKPDGLMALQAITMPDQRYDAYRRSVDFIQKHVFPGGALPSMGAMQRAVGQRTDLRLLHTEDFAEHYARTLAEWSRRFEASLDAVWGLGFDERFVRLWRYYLAYCEAGFRERQVGVCQMVYAKPRATDEVVTPFDLGDA